MDLDNKKERLPTLAVFLLLPNKISKKKIECFSCENRESLFLFFYKKKSPLRRINFPTQRTIRIHIPANGAIKSRPQIIGCPPQYIAPGRMEFKSSTSPTKRSHCFRIARVGTIRIFPITIAAIS